MWKKCVQCGEFFVKAQNTSLVDWEKRKFCSKECFNLSKKGQHPWNYKVKTKQIPWNKGKKLHYKVWNDGLHYKVSEERKLEMEKMRRDYWDNVTPKQRKARGQKISDALTGYKKPQEVVQAVTGDKSKFWKGEEATYNAKHKWNYKHWTKKDICEKCGESKLPDPTKRLKHWTQWANISGEYNRDRSDWMELCPSCHQKFDKMKRSSI